MSQAASTLTSTWLSDEAILGIEPDPSAPAAATPGSTNGAGNDSGDAADSEILISSRRAENAAVPREQREDASHAAGADANAPAAAQDADRASDADRDSRGAENNSRETPRDTSVTIHALPAATLEQLDAAYYSPEPAARAQFAQTLFANDPAAFRAMFNEAARLLGVNVPAAEEGPAEATSAPTTPKTIRPAAPGDSAAGAEPAPTFPVAQYRAFESATNDALSRDVRSAIGSTLEQVLPENTADGASRRIADDIYTDIGKQLAADAQLSAQVGEVLRGWRFGPAEQQQVNALLAGRARQLLPSAARRVIGEWTSSVLATARTRAARSEAASSRVDVGNAASRPAGNSEPARALKPKEIDYARTSDDDILSM